MIRALTWDNAQQPVSTFDSIPHAPAGIGAAVHQLLASRNWGGYAGTRDQYWKSPETIFNQIYRDIRPGPARASAWKLIFWHPGAELDDVAIELIRRQSAGNQGQLLI